VTTPTIPEMLVSSMKQDGLHSLFSFLKRTRRRYFPFSLNGRTVVTTRSHALGLVRQEVGRRVKDGAA
jgi:hypothetical protein